MLPESGSYHPSTLKTYAGGALLNIGMPSEAMPRLGEAAEMLTGTDGSMKALVWLLQARCLQATRNTDAALHLASAAVGQLGPRPAAWAREYIRILDRRSRPPKATVGPFSDLRRQTEHWGVATT
jgi:hypothetical protein